MSGMGIGRTTWVEDWSCRPQWVAPLPGDARVETAASPGRTTGRSEECCSADVRFERQLSFGKCYPYTAQPDTPDRHSEDSSQVGEESAGS